MASCRIFLAVIGTLSVISGTSSVQITKLYVPRGASHEAPLDCKYDLESDQLYDVKWYKDGLQFFRCLPNGEIMEYEVEGVKVVHSNFAPLGSCPLTLMMLSRKSAGEYKCEVSTEGPAFKTAVAAGKLRIIESSRRIQNDTKHIPSNDIKVSAVSMGAANKISYSLLLYVPLLIKYIIY